MTNTRRHKNKLNVWLLGWIQDETHTRVTQYPHPFLLTLHVYQTPFGIIGLEEKWGSGLVEMISSTHWASKHPPRQDSPSLSFPCSSPHPPQTRAYSSQGCCLIPCSVIWVSYCFLQALKSRLRLPRLPGPANTSFVGGGVSKTKPLFYSILVPSSDLASLDWLSIFHILVFKSFPWPPGQPC